MLDVFCIIWLLCASLISPPTALDRWLSCCTSKHTKLILASKSLHCCSSCLRHCLPDQSSQTCYLFPLLNSGIFSKVISFGNSTMTTLSKNMPLPGSPLSHEAVFFFIVFIMTYCCIIDLFVINSFLTRNKAHVRGTYVFILYIHFCSHLEQYLECGMLSTNS